MLPLLAAIDFEGDQWTFFKPPHDELRELYGVDVQELNVWRPLRRARAGAPRGRQAGQHRGRRVLAARHGRHRLPARSTRRRRSCIQDLDLERAPPRLLPQRRLLRARGRGLRAAVPRSTRRPTRRSCRCSPSCVRVDRVVRRPVAELRAMSRALLARHLARRPADNPVRALRAALRDRSAAGSPGEGPRLLSRVGVRDRAPARRRLRARRRCTSSGSATPALAPAAAAFDDDQPDREGVHPQGGARRQRQARARRTADVRRDGRGLAGRHGHARRASLPMTAPERSRTAPCASSRSRASTSTRSCAAATADRSTFGLAPVPRDRAEMVDYVAACARRRGKRGRAFAVRGRSDRGAARRIVGSIAPHEPRVVELARRGRSTSRASRGAPTRAIRPTSPRSATPGSTPRRSARRSTRPPVLLLMRTRSTTWHVHRLVLKTDARNQRSRAAIERLGGQLRGDPARPPARRRRDRARTPPCFQSCPPSGPRSENALNRLLGSPL